MERLPAGTRLPLWQALDLDGNTVAIPAQGKPTLVNFWASWCEPCRTEMPLLQQMADFYSDRLVLQAVNFKERAVARCSGTCALPTGPFRPARSLGAGAQAWNVKVFPTTVGFDAQGRALPGWRMTGEYDWTSAGSRQAGGGGSVA